MSVGIVGTGWKDGRAVDTFFTTGETKAKAMAEAKYDAASRKAQGMVPRGTRYTFKVSKQNSGRRKHARSKTRVSTNSGKRKMKSGSKKLAAWVRSQIKRNPRARVKTRVVRKNSTTIKGYKSVTIKKLPDGRVQVTGRK